MRQMAAKIAETSVDVWEWVPVTVEQLTQIVVETKGILDGVAITFGENVGIYDEESLLEAAAQHKLWYSNDMQSNDLNEETIDVESEMQEVCEWLWQSDAFNMWDNNELVSLAYVLDCMCQSMSKIEYYDKLLEWREFANMKQWKSFALSISSTAVQMLGLDARFVLSDNERMVMMEKYVKIRNSAKENSAMFFGVVPIRCAPDWFHETVHSILEEQKCLLKERFDSAAKSYGLSDEETALIYRSMSKVCNELLLEMDWVLRFGEFKCENQITTYDHNLGKIMRAEDYYQEINGHKTIIGAYISMLLTMNENITSRHNNSNN
jgi:hypothetical protein